MTGKPILCLDFDGVLHSYTSGWKGADVIPDPPVPGAAEALEDYFEHFEVHVFSSRSCQGGGIKAMMEWCALEFGHELARQLHWPTEKPPAMIGIDDRVVTFTGHWPAGADLRNFKPWNKGGGLTALEQQLLTLLDRIEVEEDYGLADRRFQILESLGYKVAFGEKVTSTVQ